MSISAAEVREVLRKRYAAPEWALLFEVANGTGAGQSRYADAVAMNMYPSRGLAVHGFEIKVARSDWQKELSQPDKANEIARFCDFWWLVAPEKIVQPHELPLGWGHIAPLEDGKCKVLTNASAMKPEALSRTFVAALLRREAGAAEADISARVKAEVSRRRAGDEDRIRQEIDVRTSRNAEAVKFLDDLSADLGLEARQWSRNHEVMTALRMVAQMKLSDASWTFEAAKSAAEQFLKILEPVTAKPKSKARAA